MLSTIPTPNRQTISSATGTLSFIIWLFAQSPQLYENYRRGSIDGLSSVFLTQWMLGDATNLLGCILTQQLPFQIAVATYFCCIDVCIMLQYAYYWNKATRQRKRGKRSRRESLTYASNPYSVLSETSELLPGRRGVLRSASQRRGLSHSQQLLSRDMVGDGAKHHSRSRHRPPQPSLSRTGSSDTVAALANYRALSDAALSVAQLAQEVARRREAILHRAEGGEEDHFSHRKGSRSKSRTASSPNHSLPASRSRSRVNSGELERVDLAAIEQVESAGRGRTKSGSRSMSARRKGLGGGSREFVPSALSPTREQASTMVNEQDETEGEGESSSEADSNAAMVDSVASLAATTNTSSSTEASTESLVLEPRGRDMVRTATRIESESAVTTPGGVRREATSSPSSVGSSDGTARHASHQPAAGMSRSHHQLGQSHPDSDEDEDEDEEEKMKNVARRKGKRSMREVSPSAMYRSIDALVSTNDKDRYGSRKRTMTRSSSSRSHSKRLATSQLVGMTWSTSTATTAATAGGKKRAGTKSPASMRRSIGMVLLGIMLLSSPPTLSSPTPTYTHTLTSNSPLSLLSLLDDGSVASWNRLIGRISAWLCALLYITSRIPQIWENHIRRSVAGLSILLFIAAFSGNLLYTISVLSNPEAVGKGARVYLQESLPFLLGSGGTLVFDLIIVAQWFAWRKNE